MPQMTIGDNDYVLLVSAGKTDLQLVAAEFENSSLHFYRGELGFGVRDCHEKFFAQDRYSVVSEQKFLTELESSHSLKVDTLEKKILNNGFNANFTYRSKENRFDWEKQEASPLSINSDDFKNKIPTHKAPWLITEDGDKPIVIPAKLDRIINELTQDKSQHHRCVGAVVFQTCRNPQTQNKNLKRHTRSEPSHVGPVLAKWLAQTLDLDYSGTTIKKDHAFYINIVEGEEFFELEDNQNYPILRACATRIDQTIQQLAEFNPNARIVLSLSGGISEFQRVMEASARFYFNRNHILYYRESESTEQKTQKISFNGSRVSVIDSLNARNQAVEAVKQGDFCGAYSAIEHLDYPRSPETYSAIYDRKKNSEDRFPTESWIIAVRNYARFFSSYDLEKNIQTPFLNELNNQLNSRQLPQCLFSALKVESALKNHRYLDALSSTYNFVENILFDSIIKTSHTESPTSQFNAETKKFSGSLSPKLKQLTQNNKLKIIGKNRDSAYEYIAFDAVKELLDRFYKKKAAQAVDPLSTLRNQLIHSTVSQAHIENLLKSATALEFWLPDHAGESSSYSFLCSQLVSEALSSIIGSNPMNDYLSYYQQLESELSKILLNYSVEEINSDANH